MTAFLAIFAAVFVAELGDKTQLATMLFATDRATPPWLVFVASSAALVACSALGVAAGALVGQFLDPRLLKTVAGGGFVIIGIVILAGAWR